MIYRQLMIIFNALRFCLMIKKLETIPTQDLQLRVGVDGAVCVLGYALIHAGIFKSHFIQSQLPLVILKRTRGKTHFLNQL